MSMEKDQFDVRDMRSKEQFRVDDEYLNGYARICGPNATLVYLCLCRHSDRNQESFPSIEGMAEKTGISRDSVMRGIRMLIEWGIIAKRRERRKDQTWLNNRYLLLDKSVWKPKPSSSQQHGVPKSQIEPTQVAHSDLTQVAHSDTKEIHKNVSTHEIQKDTHTKETHLAKPTVSPEGALIIEKFLTINPSLKYGNRTQRQACDEMINVFGLEETLSLVDMVIAVQGKPYAPRATTPYAMWQKIGDFKVFFDSEKTKHKAPEILRVLDDDFSEQLARLDKEKGVM